MSRVNKYSAILALLIGMAWAGLAQAALISVVSGGGTTMLVAPAVAGFPVAFTAADFTNALATPAVLVTTPHAAWGLNGTLPGYASAQWISTNATPTLVAPSSALYAIQFIWTGAVANAVLDFSAYVDNYLGDLNNQGLFLNGVAIAGTATPTASLLGNFKAPGIKLAGLNVSSMLVQGVNTLYVNATSPGGAAGIMFGATISTVAVPSSISLLALGLLLMLLFTFGQRFFLPTSKP